MTHGQKGPWKKHNLIPQTIIGSEPEDARPFVQLRYVLVKRSGSKKTSCHATSGCNKCAVNSGCQYV